MLSVLVEPTRIETKHTNHTAYVVLPLVVNIAWITDLATSSSNDCLSASCHSVMMKRDGQMGNRRLKVYR